MNYISKRLFVDVMGLTCLKTGERWWGAGRVPAAFIKTAVESQSDSAEQGGKAKF